MRCDQNKLLLLSLLVVIAFTAGCGNLAGRVEWGQGESNPGKIGLSNTFVPPGEMCDLAGVVILTQIDLPGRSDSIVEVYGKFESIPCGWRLYAFLEDRYRFYLQYPPVRVDMSRKCFSHRNIVVGNGVTKLHICLVSPDAAALLDRRASQQNWSGMPMLPDGVIIADTVPIGGGAKRRN